MIPIGKMFFIIGGFAVSGSGLLGSTGNAYQKQSRYENHENGVPLSYRDQEMQRDAHEEKHTQDNDEPTEKTAIIGAQIQKNVLDKTEKPSTMQKIKNVLTRPFHSHDAQKTHKRKTQTGKFKPVLTEAQVLEELKRLNVNVRLTDQAGNLLYSPQPEKPSMVSWLLKHCKAFGWGIETNVRQHFSDPSGRGYGVWSCKTFHKKSPASFTDSKKREESAFFGASDAASSVDHETNGSKTEENHLCHKRSEEHA